jgi:amino acid transporter
MGDVEQVIPGSEQEHALGEQRGRLMRTLTGFANFALTYSGVGGSAGIFALFGLSLASAGAAFFWGWPFVVLGTLFVCLIWAELASHYPFAGVMYQWPALLAGRRVGWWVGWMYIFAAITLATASYLIVPFLISQLFSTTFTTGQSVLVALSALAVATVFNALGIRILGKFTEYSVILELTAVVGITVLVLIFGAHHSPAVLMSTNGTAHTFGSWLAPFLGGGILISLFVHFLYENGGTLGEETVDASKNAPRAVLGALGVMFVVGLLFLFVLLISAPNISKLASSSSPIQDVINNALPSGFTKAYVAVIVWVGILASNVAFTSATRQLFSMARDGGVPFSRVLSRTRRGTPWVAVLVVATITGIPLFFSSAIGVLATAATAYFYVVYFAVMIIVMAARLRGWPHERKAFNLGRRWGFAVNLVAIVWTGAMAVVLLWPRPATNPTFHGLRVSAWLIGVPLVIGIIYYAAFQHRQLDRSASGEIPATAPPLSG